MPASFSLSYPSDEFNLPLCVSSGQVFRWQELSPGEWLGVDGPYWFLVRIGETGSRGDGESDEGRAGPPSRTGRVAEERSGEGALDRVPGSPDLHPPAPSSSKGTSHPLQEEGDRGRDYESPSAHTLHTATPQHRHTKFHVTTNGTEADFVRLFRLDWSTREIERQIIERGPELAPYMEGLRGLRVLCCSDPYEVLFTFLCTPNNNLRRITAMVRRLAEYGEPIGEVRGQVLHRFPPPEVIAAIPEEELRAKGFGYRGRTIPRVAQQILMKPAGWLESLKAAELPPPLATDDRAVGGGGGQGGGGHAAHRLVSDSRDSPESTRESRQSTVSYRGAHAELCTLDGVGAKLADCVALFGLHHMESAPVDTHLWQAACRLYFPDWKGKALTDMKYRQLGDFLRERFGTLTGWAHQYLFYENLLNWRARR